MQNFHKSSELSYIEVKKNPQFIDWTTKPRDFKEYPKFYRRYSLLGTSLENLKYIGCKTFEKCYGRDLVTLRANPSAGGLYPCEVYLQIRGVKGFISGIYHYEPLKESLTLIYELVDDGIEFYLNSTNENGIIFLISSTYFRSSWKYENRAVRYILLDIGHQIGSIIASLELENRDYEIIFDFDKKALDETFCFDGYEFFACAIKSTTPKEKSSKKLRMQIPFVLASDYFIRNQFLDNFFQNEQDFGTCSIKKNMLFKTIKNLEFSIKNRRSIRAFKKEPIIKEEYEKIFFGLFDFLLLYDIELFYNVHEIVDLKQGSYKNGKLLKEGNFSSDSKYLSMEQTIGGNSALTMFFSSKDCNNLQLCYLICGYIAHIIFLRCIDLDISCSGIGAYYDKEIKEFFGTKNDIIYLCAIGR